ncbi:hypothetical protein [Oceanivirga salmonicida]|nr:hypothetical protein [Oceanivirga salmonicida]
MKYLESYKDKLIKVYYGDEEKIYDIGYIKAEDEDCIVIKTIDIDFGLDDGYCTIFKDEIDFIEIDTQDLKDLQILIKENSKENISNSYIFKNTKLELSNQNLLINLIKEIMDKKVICKIILSNEEKSAYGFIKEIIDDNKILVSYFDEKTLIDISNVSTIHVDTISHRENYMLDNMKKNY